MKQRYHLTAKVTQISWPLLNVREDNTSHAWAVRLDLSPMVYELANIEYVNFKFHKSYNPPETNLTTPPFEMRGFAYSEFNAGFTISLSPKKNPKKNLRPKTLYFQYPMTLPKSRRYNLNETKITFTLTLRTNNKISLDLFDESSKNFDTAKIETLNYVLNTFTEYTILKEDRLYLASLLTPIMNNNPLNKPAEHIQMDSNFLKSLMTNEQKSEPGNILICHDSFDEIREGQYPFPVQTGKLTLNDIKNWMVNEEKKQVDPATLNSPSAILNYSLELIFSRFGVNFMDKIQFPELSSDATLTPYMKYVSKLNFFREYLCNDELMEMVSKVKSNGGEIQIESLFPSNSRNN